MNAMLKIKPVAETADTVTLRRADLEALIEAIEDAEDRAALAALDRQEAVLGRERAGLGVRADCGSEDGD